MLDLDVRRGEFRYSQQVAERFLYRHNLLEALHQAYLNWRGQPMDGYASSLLDGWMRYLEDGEVVALDTDMTFAGNGKQAHFRIDMSHPFPHRMGIVYNVNYPGEDAREIEYSTFELMSPKERQQLVEQHPEILALDWRAYDGVFNRGVLPQAFVQSDRSGRLLTVRAFEGFLQPEWYISDLNLQRVLNHVRRLIDDTHIYSIDGERKGEVCLACKRVDP